MRRIVVATDFSTRSDRAIRRAVLLAKSTMAELVLVHAVDDDQPQHLVALETDEAKRLLAAQTSTLREMDGVDASFRIVTGDPFTSIAQAAEDTGADVLIVGPHRRQILKDAFIGTTAERIIRTSRAPVIMANATPAAPYRHILVAVDMSESSAIALRLAADADWGDKPALSVAHCFDPPEQALRGALLVPDADRDRYLAEAKMRASAELAAFLRETGVRPVRQIAEQIELDAASTIDRVAKDAGADLIVVGQRGRSGLEKLMLGSVAEAVLRNSELDVLVAPRERSPDSR